MKDNIKVAISSDFLTAFARLPRQVQGKVTEFVNKFRNNPICDWAWPCRINRGCAGENTRPFALYEKSDGS